MFCTCFFFYSDSKEDRPADNKADISIPVIYDAGVVLSRWSYFYYYFLSVEVLQCRIFGKDGKCL